MVVLVFAKHLILIIYLRGGFDIGDEGMIMLNIGNPSQYKGYLGFYFLGQTCSLFNISGIVGVRLAKLIFETLALLTFAYSLSYFHKKQFEYKRLILLVFISSGLGPFARAFSYTELTYSLVLIIASFSLVLYRVRKGQRLISLVTGMVTGVLFFLKFPLTFIVGLLTVGYYILIRKGSVVYFFTGMFTGTLLFSFLLYDGPSSMLGWMKKGLELLHLAGYTAFNIISFNLFFDFLPLIFFATIILFIEQRSLKNLNRYRLVIIFAVIIFIVRLYTDSHKGISACLIPLFALFLPRELNLQELANRKGAIAVLFLCWLIPVLTVLGSRDTFFWTLPGIAGPIFLGLYATTQYPGFLLYKQEKKAVGLILGYCIVFFIVFRVVEPFGLNGTIFDQKHLISCVKEPFYGSQEDAIFWDTLDNTLKDLGYQSGDTLLSFETSPGLTYMMGGVMPNTFFQFPVADDSLFVDYFVERLLCNSGNKPILLIPFSYQSNMVYFLQKKHCVYFQDNYQLVSRIPFPYQNKADYMYNYHELHVYNPR
jgi:hypothetical protein